MITADEIRDLLTGAHFCRAREDLAGLSEADIARREQALGVAFPQQYRELLRAIGVRRGQFELGSDVFGASLNADADGMGGENDAPVSLPPGMVVFWMHQGYQFAAFTCDGGDDPPVHHFLEGRGWSMTHWPSLSAWFLGEVAWQRKYVEGNG